MLAMKHRFHEWVVSGPVPEPTTGIVGVTITGDAPDLRARLSGSGNGWSTDETSLILRPAPDSIPIYYQLTLELNSPSFTLVGAQIFHHSTDNESTQVATIFLPALTANELVLNLFHEIPITGSNVTYRMFIGVQDSSGNVHWPDPSIAFDPEGG